MLIDGIYVLIKGKYLGPPEPGPWAFLFKKINVQVYRLGPLFVLYGMSWLCWLCFFWKAPMNSVHFGLALSLFTMWYFPFGTLCSLVIFILLILL